MKLSTTAHTSRPWRIHDLAPDFRVEDVWVIPAQGDREDFPQFMDAVRSMIAIDSSSPIIKALFAVRWRLGKLFGWDENLGTSAAPSLRDRIPQDLRATVDPDSDTSPFTPLYQLDHEWAGELANETVHSILHMGWVEDGSGRHHGQMTMLVKPNGILGSFYMAAIRPFRRLFVSPDLVRRFAGWRNASAPTR